MSPVLILGCVGLYFAMLLTIAWITGRRADAAGYFLGNRRSPWYVVAFGFVGDSLSGVTFISVPGAVAATKFSYLQLVLGNVLGYVVISLVLLPLYYRLNLTSVYRYLGDRFGPWAQRTGSAFFLVSRTIGAAARLYLAVGVLQTFVFGPWGVPFVVTVAFVIALILSYTYRGGIKTLVWTDLFQSGFLLLGVLLSLVVIASRLDLGLAGLWRAVADSPHSQVFFWNDWRAENFFWKQFLGGAFVAVAMTGLDQNMMQKNLSCRSLGEAQKNLSWFSVVVVLVNVLFLSLGALLYHYATVNSLALPAKSDQLFPTLALQHLGGLAAVVFVIGLTAATFNSADSVLTTLTTSFCFDILHLDRRADVSEARRTRVRHLTHVGFAVALLLTIMAFQWLSSGAVIRTVLKVANYTYGPMLGLFAYGLLGSRGVRDRAVPVVCVVAPLLCWILDANSKAWLGGYQFSNELLAVNGALTALGLRLIAEPPAPSPETRGPAASPRL